MRILRGQKMTRQFACAALMSVLLSLSALAEGVDDKSSRDEALAPQKKYCFSEDFFSSNASVWKELLGGFIGSPNIHYLEVGMFEGRSLIWMLENVLTHKTAKATGIDIFLGDTKKIFRENIQKTGVSFKVTTLKGPSNVELRKLPFASFDIIYIDASHLAADVYSDAALCWPLLKEGGVLLFDDYIQDIYRFPDELRPKIAIDAFITAYRNYAEVVYRRGQIAVRKKTLHIPDDYFERDGGYFVTVGQYVYYLRKRQLHNAQTGEPVALSEREKDTLERIIWSRVYGYDEFMPTNEMVEDEDVICVKNKLRLEWSAKNVTSSLVHVNANMPIRSKEWGREEEHSRTQLMPADTEFVIGKPMRFTLLAKNVGDMRKVLRTSTSLSESLIMTGPDGRELLRKHSYPFTGRTAVDPRSLENKPRREGYQTNDGVVTMFKEEDISDRYVITKPGRYTLRFPGIVYFDCADDAYHVLPASNILEFVVKPGQLAEHVVLLDVLANILPDRNWDFYYWPRGHVAPDGRKTVSGFVVSARHHTAVNDTSTHVTLWVTDQPAGERERGNDKTALSAFLGRSSDYYVYISVAEDLEKVWPSIRKDIRTVFDLR